LKFDIGLDAHVEFGINGNGFHFTGKDAKVAVLGVKVAQQTFLNLDGTGLDFEVFHERIVNHSRRDAGFEIHQPPNIAWVGHAE
jgi:hypothetical protein